MVTTPEQVRAAFAERFEYASDSRLNVAEEYPEDTRNRRSAKALRELADYVRALPDTDPTIRRYLRHDDLLGYVHPDENTPGEEAARAVFQYGFHPSDPPAAFLTRYVDYFLDEYGRLVAEWGGQRLKVVENRLRRKASRQKLTLSKSRRRDEDAWDYGTYFLTETSSNNLMAQPNLNLADVVRILLEDQPTATAGALDI